MGGELDLEVRVWPRCELQAKPATRTVAHSLDSACSFPGVCSFVFGAIASHATALRCAALLKRRVALRCVSLRCSVRLRAATCGFVFDAEQRRAVTALPRRFKVLE